MMVSRNLWVKRAVTLSWFTIVYNFIEGVVSTWIGGGDESYLLFGFGADSFIEVGSASFVLWRFSREMQLDKTTNDGRDKTANLGIGLLFLLLALITALVSGVQLSAQSHPQTTLPGMIIALLSLSFMFFLWKAKLRVADQLDSKTMRSDAYCSLACIKLSTILFMGSAIYMLYPALWWIDSSFALVLSFFIGREGLEILRNRNNKEGPACC